MRNPIVPRPGYLTHPAIVDDTVVFCCEDDLWLVAAAGGSARRLTSAMSRATTPRMSPDGAQIAFCCQNDGPPEVYVLPTAGGTARRLTYDAARCSVVGWHPETGEIVYASSARQPAAFGYRLFAVSPAGGGSRLLPWGSARSVSFGPGGGIVLGRSIADPARRKRYRGGAAGQFWIRATERGGFTRLLVPGNPVDPCWVGDRVYFLTDHEGTANVYSMFPDGSGLSAHTDHREYYARNLTTDGRQLAYHAGAELYLLDPLVGLTHPIEVQLASSRSQQAMRFVAAADYLDGARLSPDGTQLSLVSRGKAFTFAHWSGPVRQHGVADGVRYTLADRLADGSRLVAAAADSRPGEHLVLLPIDSGAAEADVCLEQIGSVTELRASPTSGLVAFATNRQQLWLVDTTQDQPQPRLLDETPHERIEDLAWSFDGRWLAYTYPGTPRTSRIKVVEVLTGQTHDVTEPVFRDCRPAFDPAGRYLYFIGQRDLTPDLDQVQFDVGFPFGARPYLITLREDQPAPFPSGQLSRSEASPASTTFTDIDFAGIERRVVPLPVAEGRYSTVLGLPDRALLLRVPVSAPDPAPGDGHPEGTVSSVDLASGEVTANYLDGVDEISTDARGSAVLYRSGTRLRVLAGDTEPQTASEMDVPWAPPNRGSGWLDLNRVRVAMHPATEWRQMFREAWRMQREGYWDEAMSRVDWTAMYERYSPLVDLVRCRSELSDLLWELQGELATSHAYERGGDYGSGANHGHPKVTPPPPGQGFLGVDWCEPELGDHPPVWRIAEVLRGAPWNPTATSPCNRPGVNVSAGDEVLAINGQPLGPSGPGELLVGQAGREVELTLARAGSPPRRVCVRAVGDEARARYLDWVQRNRAYVHGVTADRLGYLHVPDMSADGYADFVRGFLNELDREGLVVDVRFNGGGHVSPLLIDRLARRRAGTEHGRWSGLVPYPLEAPHGPMVVVMNEETGSDAELFAHLFRDRGLGQLVGCRTWGGTIATWSRHDLADGTVTTQPEFCYSLAGVGMSLENRGVQPDVEVQLGHAPGGGGDHPGEDPQLAAAVRCLVAAVGAPQPSPGPGHWSRFPGRAAAARQADPLERTR